MTEEVKMLWKELLRKKPANRDLRYVIEYEDSLSEEAQKILSEKDKSTTLSPQQKIEKMTKEEILNRLSEIN